MAYLVFYILFPISFCSSLNVINRTYKHSPIVSSRRYVQVSVRVYFTNYVISEPSYRISGSLPSDSATSQVINKSLDDVRQQFNEGLIALDDERLAERNRVIIKLNSLIIKPGWIM